jgi:GntR family transcriptional regulator
LHLQLREVLIKRIANGDWQAGIAIPNEIELAREFGLSAGTVRKALDWMESAQLVVRQQGRGTFVRDQLSGDILTRFCNLRRADGTLIEATVTSAVLVTAEATAVEAQHLGLRAGEKVHRVTQIREIDGAPFAHESLVLPAAFFPKIDAKSPAVGNIGQVAFANGLLLGHGRELVSIAAASEEVARALSLQRDSPLLLLDRVIETIDGEPLEWRRSLCHLGAHVYHTRVG